MVIQQQLAAISQITDVFRRQTAPILATPFDRPGRAQPLCLFARGRVLHHARQRRRRTVLQRQRASRADAARESLAHRAARPPPGAGSAPLILLAEDNPINRMLALSQLRKLGYAVDVAEDGRAAVEKALARHYRLILMDAQMPVMDGVEATRRIRAAQAGGGERSVIVAVTANAMEGDRERLLAEGMDDYQSKPYGLEHPRALLDKWLGEPPAG